MIDVRIEQLWEYIEEDGAAVNNGVQVWWWL